MRSADRDPQATATQATTTTKSGDPNGANFLTDVLAMAER